MGIPATQRKLIKHALRYRAPKLGVTDEEAQVIGVELHHILGKHGKNPQAIIDRAREEDSSLHRFFTWDVKKAAERQWTAEALYLVRNVTVVIVDEPSGEEIQHREFVLIEEERHEDDLVVPRIFIDPDEYRQSRLEQGFMELRSFLRRFADLDEFQLAVRAVRATLKKHDKESD
jgi:hypothetical protein